jgi:hypothetical protein
LQNLILCHAGRKHVENVPHSDSEATNAGLTRALTGQNRDPGNVRMIRGCHKAHYPEDPGDAGIGAWLSSLAGQRLLIAGAVTVIVASVFQE